MEHLDLVTSLLAPPTTMLKNVNVFTDPDSLLLFVFELMDAVV